MDLRLFAHTLPADITLGFFLSQLTQPIRDAGTRAVGLPRDNASESHLSRAIDKDR